MHYRNLTVKKYRNTNSHKNISRSGRKGATIAAPPVRCGFVIILFFRCGPNLLIKKLVAPPAFIYFYGFCTKQLRPLKMPLTIILSIKKFMKTAVFITVASLFFLDCQKETEQPGTGLPFEMTPDTTAITPGLIDEASGISDSKKNPGFIWVQEDSGNPPELTLLSYAGAVQKKIHIKGAVNRDWEDIVLAAGPAAGDNYLYIAETGDNTATYPDYGIYRFKEPDAGTDTVFAWDEISFKYPDQAHDCEAIIVDNATKDIYLLSKRDSTSKIFKLAYPQSTSSTITATAAGTMTITGVCSAAISPDGTEILVKTYTNVYYWKRNTGESIAAALQRVPVTLGYVLEPQGEAICFRNDNSGFYTLSERPFFAGFVTLNLYKRK